jgi:hypothetical protein
LEENLPTWFLILILIVFTINIEYPGSPLLLGKQSKIYLLDIIIVLEENPSFTPPSVAFRAPSPSFGYYKYFKI